MAESKELLCMTFCTTDHSYAALPGGQFCRSHIRGWLVEAIAAVLCHRASMSRLQCLDRLMPRSCNTGTRLFAGRQNLNQVDLRKGLAARSAGTDFALWVCWQVSTSALRLKLENGSWPLPPGRR